MLLHKKYLDTLSHLISHLVGVRELQKLQRNHYNTANCNQIGTSLNVATDYEPDEACYKEILTQWRSIACQTKLAVLRLLHNSVVWRRGEGFDTAIAKRFSKKRCRESQRFNLKQSQRKIRYINGGGGIRTPGRLPTSAVFKTAAFNQTRPPLQKITQ